MDRYRRRRVFRRTRPCTWFYRRLRKKAKKRSQEASFVSIVSVVKNNIENVAVQVNATLPGTCAFQRTVQRVITREDIIIPNSDDLAPLQIPDVYTKTIKGEQILFHDSDNGYRRFLMFTTEKNLEKLKSGNVW